MRISIRDGAGRQRKELRAHVERRLSFALSGFQDRIGSVMVRLMPDEPAAKGGGPAGSRCEIEVRLRPRTVTVQDIDANLMTAVDNATGRLQRSLARALDHEPAPPAGQARPAARVRRRR